MKLDGVNMIFCGNTNCYVIRGENGDILIDTGLPKYRDEIETWLMNYNVKLIAITHGHNDHIGNAAYFSELYGAPIAMSVYDIGLAENNLLHKIYAVNAMGKILLTASKKLLNTQSEQFDVGILLEDGMDIGQEFGVECKAIQFDGHTRGSFGFLCGKDLYIGDAAMNYIKPGFPSICESPKAARVSIEKVKTLSPERIFFGHGNPAVADMLQQI